MRLGLLSESILRKRKRLRKEERSIAHRPGDSGIPFAAQDVHGAVQHLKKARRALVPKCRSDLCTCRTLLIKRVLRTVNDARILSIVDEHETFSFLRARFLTQSSCKKLAGWSME
jgi:hypothetical protein